MLPLTLSSPQDLKYDIERLEPGTTEFNVPKRTKRRIKRNKISPVDVPVIKCNYQNNNNNTNITLPIKSSKSEPLFYLHPNQNIKHGVQKAIEFLKDVDHKS